VGDYNFAWDVQQSETAHDVGYNLLTADGVFVLVRPPHLIKTECAFDSVLDFVFVAGAARRWRASSQILAAQNSYCPDDNTRSDHRPVLARFDLTTDGQPTPWLLLLVRIQRMEEDLSALKALVEQMPQ
jgi:endonuclease/exonuclease/phosphatase (EEP) superfamily protein YafD